jgi:hypothetical protein
MQAGFPGRCYVVDLPASLLHTVRTGWFERGAIAHRCAVNIGASLRHFGQVIPFVGSNHASPSSNASPHFAQSHGSCIERVFPRDGLSLKPAVRFGTTSRQQSQQMNLSGLPAPPSLATIVWVHIFRLQIFQRAALELLFKLAASAANLAWPKVGGTAVTPLRRGSEDAALTAAVRAFVDHYRVVVAGHFSALARRILLGAWHRRVIVGMASA